jgi:hypothetical protein
MNRIFGLTVTTVWLAAMAALVYRDVVPFWTAQEAPDQLVSDGAFQVGIRNSANVRLGTTWVRIVPTASITTVRSTTFLNLGAVVTPLPVAAAMIFDTTLTYQPDGTLGQFRFRLEGAPFPIRVVGERCGRDFACTTTFDQVKKTVPLDARLSECLAETLRPFTHLKGLHVGQSWRIRMLDHFSILQGKRPELKLQLVTVAGREKIRHGGREVECYRIETDGAVAWADDSGLVLVQEVQIPFLGKWTLTDEPYDQAARRAALGRVRDPDDGSWNVSDDAKGKR